LPAERRNRFSMIRLFVDFAASKRRGIEPTKPTVIRNVERNARPGTRRKKTRTVSGSFPKFLAARFVCFACFPSASLQRAQA
jgi:hypothetical protein